VWTVVWRDAVLPGCWQVLAGGWQVRCEQILHGTNCNTGVDEVWRELRTQVSSQNVSVTNALTYLTCLTQVKDTTSHCHLFSSLDCLPFVARLMLAYCYFWLTFGVLNGWVLEGATWCKEACIAAEDGRDVDSLRCFPAEISALSCLQCFGVVGWLTGSASGL